MVVGVLTLKPPINTFNPRGIESMSIETFLGYTFRRTVVDNPFESVAVKTITK